MLLLPALLAGSFAFSPVKQEEALTLSRTLGQPPPFEESCTEGISACTLSGNCDQYNRAWSGTHNGCCKTTKGCQADGDDIFLEVQEIDPSGLRVGRCCARYQYWTQSEGCKDRKAWDFCDDLEDIDGNKVDRALACPNHKGLKCQYHGGWGELWAGAIVCK